MNFRNLFLRAYNHTKTPAARVPDEAAVLLQEGAQKNPRAPMGTRFGRLHLPPTFLSLQYHSFRYLWIGNLFSTGAQWIQVVSISWLIYDMTNSAVLLGAVNGARLVPVAIIAPIAGVFVDRLDRRRLLFISQSFLATVAAIFAVGIWLDRVEVWHIFAFTLLMGAGSGLNTTARQAIIPNLVPRKDITNAVALGAASFNVTRVFGPSLGAILIVTLGMVWNFVLQSFFYIGSFLAVFPIRPPQRLQDQGQRPEPFSSAFAAGFRYVWGNRPVFSLLVLGLVPMLFVFPISALMPIFARDVFNMDVTGFGILLTTFGAGSLLGTLVLASLGEVKNKAVLMYSALFLMAFGLIAFSFISSLYLALVVLGLTGTATMVYFSTNMATLQMLITDDMRGRVMSFLMLDMGIVPLGTLIAGVLAEFLGGPLAVTILGSSCFLFIVIAFFALPEVRRLDRMIVAQR